MAKGEAKEDRTPGPRVVLKRERVLMLPEALTGDALEKALADVAKSVGARVGSLKPREAWQVVAHHEGSKNGAIKTHAGEPGTPGAKPGAYKSIPEQSWKGGMLYERPPEPKVEATPLD